VTTNDFEPVIGRIAVQLKAQVFEHFEVSVYGALRGFEVMSKLLNSFGRLTTQIAYQLEDPQNSVLVGHTKLLLR
jgi:hypothetical protein